MGDCVVLDQDGGCLLTLQGTRDQRCIDHLLAVEAPDSTEALNPNLCTPSSPPLEDRDRANQLINVLRRLMGGPQVEFVTNRVHGECAIITDGEVTSGEWDASQVCFDEISENSLQPSSNFERIAGYWSTYDLAFGLLSATRGYRLLTRHWLLDPRGRKLRFGMNRGSSCLSPELRNELGSIPLSFYPGAGHVPLELIHPGNHKGEAPMWSVAITDRLSVNPTVEMITLTGPNDQGTPRAITTARPDPDHPELIGWTLDEPAREGETFLLKVSWQDSAMASRSVKLYSHLISCGQLMPVRCDPARVDECVVPGHSCVYYNYEPEDAPGWYCQRTGPLALGEPCSGYSGSCAGETLCFALTPNEPSRCVQRCVLGDDQSPNSCALRCANFAEVGEVAGSSIGVCVDP